MTSYAACRCRHCQIPYNSLASGFGWGDEQHSHPDYCEDCWSVIVVALEALPKVREKVWVEAGEGDPTLADLVARREAALTKARKEQGIPEPEHEPVMMLGEPQPVGSIPPREIALSELKPRRFNLVDRAEPAQSLDEVVGARIKEKAAIAAVLMNPDKAGAEDKAFKAMVDRDASLLTEPLPKGTLPIYDGPPPQKHLFFVERIGVGLFDTTGKRGSQLVYYTKIGGVDYCWDIWSKTGEGSVRKAMEKELPSGEILGPWKEFR